MDVERSLMFTTWEAVLLASYFINCMPRRILNFQTPLSAFIEIYPQTKLFTSLPLKVFGYVAFVHMYNHLRSKLDPKVVKCDSVWFSPTQKGYKCYDPVSKKLFVIVDVTFFKNKPFFPQTSFQCWGGRRNSREDQFWENLSMPIVQTSSV